MIVKNLKAIEQCTFLDLIQKYTIIHAYMYIHREGCHIGFHVPCILKHQCRRIQTIAHEWNYIRVPRPVHLSIHKQKHSMINIAKIHTGRYKIDLPSAATSALSCLTGSSPSIAFCPSYKARKLVVKAVVCSKQCTRYSCH